MKPDSHLSDILHMLRDPEEYVRGIVGSFVECGFDRNEAVVRIGVSGTGIVPNYSIEQATEPSTVELSSVPGLKLTVTRRRDVFSGKNHLPILDDFPEGESWSSTAMTFAEVQAVLGHLRASRKTN